MSDLAGFLLARIAEDEQAARASLAWASETPDQRWSADDGALLDGRSDTMASYVGDDVAPHIARWDPARVLAECEAKRRIVEAAERYRKPHPGQPHTNEADGYEYEPCYLCVTSSQRGERIDDAVLPLLALPYADHPDYDENWRP